MFIQCSAIFIRGTFGGFVAMRKFFVGLMISITFSSHAFSQTPRKTVTNRDLEKFRAERLKAEADYRANYKKRGMPSPEELEQREIARQRELAESARLDEAQRSIAQGDFAGRASFLRSQIVSLEAQISYLNNELGRLPQNRTTIYSVGYIPYGYQQYGDGQPHNFPRQQDPYLNGARTVASPSNRNFPRSPSVVVSSPNQTYGNNFPTAHPYRSGTTISAGIGSGNVRVYGRVNYGRGYYPQYPYYGGAVLPQNYNSREQERSELVSQLRLLNQELAGLYAQWDILVEDARRAGISIR